MVRRKVEEEGTEEMLETAEEAGMEETAGAMEEAGMEETAGAMEEAGMEETAGGREKVEVVCDIYPAIFVVDENVLFLRKIRRIAEEHRTHIILFDADRLAGRAHAEAALRHAWRSWTGNEAIANSIEMEALLYAAGTRQCQVAASFGIHPGENRSYIAVCPSTPAVRDRLAGLVTFVGEEQIDSSSPKKRESLMNLFDITPEEVAVVGEERFRDLVLERVALLDVYR